MLATVTRILSYIQWLSLIAFVVVFGVQLITCTVIGAVATFVCAIALLFIFVEGNAKTYSPGSRICSGAPVGMPLVDIVLGIYAVQRLVEGDEWEAFFAIGVLVVALDLVLWILRFFDKKNAASRSTD